MTAMKLHGIFAPLTTPFDADGNVALGQVRNNVALYNKTKLAGYVPNGSTSESVLLRGKRFTKSGKRCAMRPHLSKILIAGTGAESTAETIEHTNRAATHRVRGGAGAHAEFLQAFDQRSHAGRALFARGG